MTDIIDEPIAIEATEALPEDTETVRIAILVDESGSMLSATESTVKSLNSYLDEQAQSDKPVMVSLYTFESNQGVRNRFRGVDAKATPRMFRNNDLFDNPELDRNLIYAPSGNTPLFDAIAAVINTETDGTPTLIVILTDGEENASREYPSLDSIQALIKQQEEQGWTFVFMMAGLSRTASESYTRNLMGRDYVGATMTYEKGMEHRAFIGLATASANWSVGAREVKTSGGIIDTATVTQDFFSEEQRDIKKKD